MVSQFFPKQSHAKPLLFTHPARPNRHTPSHMAHGVECRAPGLHLRTAPQAGTACVRKPGAKLTAMASSLEQKEPNRNGTPS